MPTSSSSALAARQVFASRLRQLRDDAGLNGRDLARRLGWTDAKSSRIANGKTLPSEHDIRDWCGACGAEDEVSDLLASLRTIEGMWVEWRRMTTGGLRPIQAAALTRYERTTNFKSYSCWLIPGMLQSREYVRAVLRRTQERYNLVDDVEAATDSRLERQKLLLDGNRRFAFLIEEHVLRSSVVDVDVMAAQLGHLLAIGSPNVTLGIVPMKTDRGRWPVESFWMFDEALVHVELVSGELKVTQPRELAMYSRTFQEIGEQAVYGRDARRLIAAALEALT